MRHSKPETVTPINDQVWTDQYRLVFF